MLMRYLLSVSAWVLLSSCAGVNKHTEKYFDRSEKAALSANAATNVPGRGTIYLLWPNDGGLQFTFVPVGPTYFAVDNTMLAVMPVGSHVVLSLPPGRHKFTSFREHSNLRYHELSRKDIEIDVVADQTYFLSQRYIYLFEVVDATYGRDALLGTALAKMIHQPISVEAFVSNFEASKRERAKSNNDSARAESPRNSSSGFLSDLLPTAKKIGEIVEGIAAVALIGLLVAGAGASAGPSPAAIPPMAYSNSTPATQRAPASVLPPRAIQPATQAWQNSSGTLSEIVRSDSGILVRDASNATTYSIAEGRISGSDGSRFRVIGSTIYSDTGQTYQVIGNSLFASDGRKCERIGSTISCN